MLSAACSRLKVSFKHSSQVLEQHFKSSKCLLLISVGQEAHEGRHFEKTIELLNSSFAESCVLLGDSIQRYTMSLASTQHLPDYYYQISIKEGDAWLLRNGASLSKLKIPYSIIRWDYWLSHPDFPKMKELLEIALDQDADYHDAFTKTVNVYLERYQKQRHPVENLNLQRSESICFNYLLEECAIFCLWPELSCEFEIYPNAHNLAIQATKQKFLTQSFPNLLHSVSLRFRHAGYMKPLQFEALL